MTLQFHTFTVVKSVKGGVIEKVLEDAVYVIQEGVGVGAVISNNTVESVSSTMVNGSVKV